MAQKNSQILLIENVLSGLNENLNDKNETIQNLEDEISKLKSTITTLKHECKTAFNEQERLEENILDVKKQNIYLCDELQSTKEELNTITKEFDSSKLQHKQFMDSVEKKIDESKREINNKNSIILELENINKALNKQIHFTEKEKTISVSKLERKLEEEEFKNFINTDNNYAFSSQSSKTTPVQSKVKSSIQLDKLENKLKNTKKETTPASSQTPLRPSEEDILKKNLGF